MTTIFNWLWLLVALLLFGFYGFVGGGEVTECATEDDGCGTAVPVVEAWPGVVIDGHEGVIVPEDAAQGLLLLGFEAPEGYWTPTEADLRAAEDAIAGEVAKEPGASAPVLEGYRQYAGYTDASGDHKVFVNSFCVELDDWRSNVAWVMDGGSCFWQAVYNVDTGEVERISVNFDA